MESKQLSHLLDTETELRDFAFYLVMGVADSQSSIHGSDVSYMENDSKEGGML